jgi:pyruvate/2-oxoglutarate dehydrogenase complex dihydrolipoamide dehydrogenase (E3) component
VTPDDRAVVTADRLPETTPERVLVAGGGARGLAAAAALAAAGRTVTLVDMQDGLLTDDDPDVAAAVAAHVAAAGVTVRTAHRLIGLDAGEGPVTARLLDIAARAETPLEAGMVVIATGRRARSRDLGLDTTAAETDRLGRVLVDARMQTAEPGVWSLGSVVAASSSPDATEAEAATLASALLGESWQPVRYRRLPQIIDLSGVVAARAGLTAAAAGHAGHLVTRRRTDGAHGIRIAVVDQERDVLLGLHAYGPGAGAYVRQAAAGLGRPVDDAPLAAAEEA